MKQKEEGAVATDVDIDIGLLKSEIKKTYAAVSEEPDRQFIFPDRTRVGRGSRVPTRAR
jgi:hypothetical protein